MALTHDAGLATFLAAEDQESQLFSRQLRALANDQDTVLVRVEALGPGVCHEGYRSCFYRRLEDGAWVVCEERAYNPNQVYGSKS